jgi:uncharacterized OB-fold protein
VASADRPGPIVHPDNAEFWNHLREHELRLQCCAECGFVRYPVSPVCPECLSEEHSWERMSGRGRLASCVTVWRATGHRWWTSRTPFAVALVHLEEGPRLKGAIDVEAARDLAPGDRVRVAFEDIEDTALLRFEPEPPER